MHQLFGFRLRETRAACFLLLACVVGAGCGSKNDDGPPPPPAVARFCNGLSRSGADFEAYLTISGSATNERWTAMSGTCSPCKNLTGGEQFSCELGDDTDWLVRFKQTLANGKHYAFVAEMDAAGTSPTVNMYTPNPGKTCDNLMLQ